MTNLPLDGIKILDLTGAWAGPFITNLMGTLGAEVIKVEAIQRLDLWRSAGTATLSPRDSMWEWSPLWNPVNTDKKDITLDLTRPEGIDIIKKLVRICDVVAENYAPRVMENFGLTYPVLRQLNPKLIMISMPAHGTTGPWKDFPGFADPIEEMSGHTQLNGYQGTPKLTNWGLTDAISGLNGLAAVIFAVIALRRTGKGQYIDLSQVEANTGLIGEVIADYSMNRRVNTGHGNNHPSAAPQGFYRCKGDDLWVGITVGSDDEWIRLGRAAGDPPWAEDDRFSTRIARWQNRDELDRLVESWTVQHDHYHVMNTLQKAGVAAGAVLTGAELLSNPHLVDRQTFRTVERKIVGPRPYPVPTTPIRFSKYSIGIRRPAPLLGEHNVYVLKDLLGLTDDEIKTLEESKIIGTRPLGAEPQ